MLVFPILEKPVQENPAQLNTYILNTKIIKYRYINPILIRSADWFMRIRAGLDSSIEKGMANIRSPCPFKGVTNRDILKFSCSASVGGSVPILPE